MKIVETNNFKEPKLFYPTVYEDDRGFFMESFNDKIQNEFPNEYVLFLSHSPYYPYNLQLIRFISKILNDRSKLEVFTKLRDLKDKF